MPLEKGKSNEVLQRNIAELIKAGHKPSQAAAIAYKKAGRDAEGEGPVTYVDMMNSARESENEAIALWLKVITVAPPEDVAQIAEIVGDENDHLGICSRILMRYQKEDGEETEEV